MSHARWAILTGEYPPMPGGVADYTRQVAQGLVSAGDSVTVFAPPPAGDGASDGVNVVKLPDHFGPRGLMEVDRLLVKLRPDRVVVQYVPHAFGYKAMNLPFVVWLATRGRRLAPLWAMFHEVSFPFRWRPVTHMVLGSATKLMARLIAGAADRIFVSVPAWGERLRRLCPHAKTAEWLPIPSNVPVASATDATRNFSEGTVLGHFGTYGPATADLLDTVMSRSLDLHPDWSFVLIGRGAAPFRDRFLAKHAMLAPRVSAPGELPADALARHLRGCDLLVQPFIDGISSRRTSMMAGLAMGMPIVSNLGALSEPLWSDVDCLGLASAPDGLGIVSAVETVLAKSASDRVAMGERAASLYRERFSLENTLRRLRSSAVGS